MGKIVKYLVIMCSILNCKCVNFREQWDDNQIVNKKGGSEETEEDEIPYRRLFNRFYSDSIIGAPSEPSHLPEAEAILPGHTLIRPAMGMLKSAVKFPHKELENGAGVYGNIDNLGLRYDGQDQRVLYSGFRRTNLPSEYLVVAPLKTKPPQSKIFTDYYSKPTPNKYVYKSTNGDPVTITLLPKIKILVYGSRVKTGKKELRSGDNDENVTGDGNKNVTGGDNENITGGDNENDSGEDNENDSGDMKEGERTFGISQEAVDNNHKKHKFWNSKDMYNHIKINQEAPDQNELMPGNINEDIRIWWFFNQDDYKPFNKYTDK